MDKFTKQSYESFTVAANFSNNMASDETITSQTVVAIDSNGLDSSTIVLEQASVSNDGSFKVLVLVKDGTQVLSGKDGYKITFKAVTSIGHKWELDIMMKVKEL